MRWPLGVSRMIRIDCSTSVSWLDNAIRPRWSTATGNAHPEPRKSREISLTASSYPPIRTVPVATTVPTGASTGSLQVMAVSPFRAAGLPLMNTVELPFMICPIFVGGFEKDPPIGMCGGVLLAMLPTVAAGMLMIFTFVLKLLCTIPAKGSGMGVGTGAPAAAGTKMMCVSVAVT